MQIQADPEAKTRQFATIAPKSVGIAYALAPIALPTVASMTLYVTAQGVDAI